jgi:hypothetical protein
MTEGSVSEAEPSRRDLQNLAFPAFFFPCQTALLWTLLIESLHYPPSMALEVLAERERNVLDERSL